MTTLRRFGLLAGDAVRDGVRNRVGLFALIAALLVGLFADRCTDLGGGGFVLNGRTIDASDAARFVGPLLFGTCSLLLVWIAGFLACDALARPLSERTAVLWLARPVGRGAYALARLAGALGLAVGAGVVVLSAVAVLLHLRLGLALPPAAVGIAVFAACAWVVAAFGMTLALFLPRVVALAAVTLALQLVVAANALHLVADSEGGLLHVLDRFGPPLGRAFVLALAPWLQGEAATSDWIAAAGSLMAWGAGLSLLLVLAFRRRDLPT